MAIKNLQVTIGASVTPILAAGNIRARSVTFQDNDAHAMAVGGSDSSVGTGATAKGVQLVAGGSYYQGWSGPGQTNLHFWYVAGTQNDVLTVVYDDGNDTAN